MNTYECMYIIQTSLSDEEADKTNQRIAEEIEKRGGSILHRERLGKRRLAYPIRKQDDGAYYLIYFELPPGEVAAVRLAYRLHPRLLRFLMLSREREEIVKLQRRTREPERPTAAPGESDAGGTAGAVAAADDKESAADAFGEGADGALSDETTNEPEPELTSEDAAPELEPDKQE